MPTPLAVTGDPDADALLNENPLALMVGMLLDQQIAIEWAFASPAKLRDRLGGELDAHGVAAMGEDEIVAAFATKPALHRYPASMAKRTQALCRHLVEHHGGRADAVWTQAADAPDLRRRLLAIPGFGKQKTQIFIALLAKRFGVTPDGWEAQAGHYAEAGFHSVADLDGPDSVAALREHRAAMKATKTKSNP